MSRARLPNWPVFLMLSLSIWAGFALRLNGLEDQSLWFDETATGVSIRDAKLNPLLVEAHSMLYILSVAPFYAMLPTDFGLRWPSIIAGILSIAVIYRLGKQVMNERAGLIAASLLSISPYFIHYSREVRHYSLVALITLIILWLVMRSDLSRWQINAIFIGFTVLLAGLHALSVLWLGPLLVMLAFRRVVSGQGPRMIVIISSVLGIFLILIAIRTVGMMGRGYLEGLGWIASLSLIQLPKKFFTQGLGIEWLSPLVKRLILAVVLVSTGIGVWLGRRSLVATRWHLTLLIVISIAPIVIVAVLSFIFMPLWVLRYLTPSLVTFIMLTSIILAHIRGRMLGALGFGALIAAGILSYIVHPEEQPEDWLSVKAYLDAELDDQDVVFTCGSLSAVPLAYYMPDLTTYYLTNVPGFPDVDSSEALLTQTKAPPSTIPDEVERVWIVNRNGRLCSLEDYAIDTSVLSNEPGHIQYFTGVTLILYERADLP